MHEFKRNYDLHVTQVSLEREETRNKIDAKTKTSFATQFWKRYAYHHRMNEFFLSKLKDEEEVNVGGNHPTMATTTLSTTTTADHNVAIFSGDKAENAPYRNRVAVPTRASTAIKMTQSTTPSENITLSPATKPLFFIPPPPPLLGNSRIGRKVSASSPVFLPDPSTGASFHPDFIFCGACTDCTEESDEAPARMLSRISIDNNNHGRSSDSEPKWAHLSDDGVNGFLQTSFQLKQLRQQQIFDNAMSKQQEQHQHNKILVLESLICAIPGIRKVSIPDTQSIPHTSGSSSAPDFENIVVHHDASVHTGTIRHAFESAGYSATIRHSSTTVGKASAVAHISTPKKDDKQSEAESDISNLDMVVKDKGQTLNLDSNGNNESRYWVRSSFKVEGICCASEIPAIRRILKPFLGVAKVNINLTTKVVHVQHHYVQIQASQIALALTEQGFPAQIRKDGSSTAQFESTNTNFSTNMKDKQVNIKSVTDVLDRIKKSPFVESTLTIEGLRADQVHLIERAIAESFIRVQVRAVYPSSISETIKVEHNPDLVSIVDIRDFLRRRAMNMKSSFCFPSTAEVYIDGADNNLYLPNADDYTNQPTIRHHNGRCFFWIKRYHINVVLSGLFWILSMISVVDGM